MVVSAGFAGPITKGNLSTSVIPFAHSCLIQTASLAPPSINGPPRADSRPKTIAWEVTRGHRLGTSRVGAIARTGYVTSWATPSPHFNLRRRKVATGGCVILLLSRRSADFAARHDLSRACPNAGISRDGPTVPGVISVMALVGLDMTWAIPKASRTPGFRRSRFTLDPSAECCVLRQGFMHLACHERALQS
jgi:hypothetical protein